MVCQSGDNYFPKRFSDFLVYMEWVIVDGETWILETDHEWDGGYIGVVPKTSSNLSVVVGC